MERERQVSCVLCCVVLLFRLALRCLVLSGVVFALVFTNAGRKDNRWTWLRSFIMGSNSSWTYWWNILWTSCHGWGGYRSSHMVWKEYLLIGINMLSILVSKNLFLGLTSWLLIGLKRISSVSNLAFSLVYKEYLLVGSESSLFSLVCKQCLLVRLYSSLLIGLKQKKS